MRKILLSTLLIFIFIFPLMPLALPLTAEALDTVNDAMESLDFYSLAKSFGGEIPVIVRFSEDLTQSEIDKIRSLGIRFSLGSPATSRVENFYVLRGPADGLSKLAEMGIVDDIGVQTLIDNIHSPRDLSIPEINADDVWNILDGMGRNVTGEGILIADLDSGIDWLHPDFWFADGGEYNWSEIIVDDTPTNGSDFIDLNGDTVRQPGERLYYLDYNNNGIFDTSTEWIWADNVSQNAEPDMGEPFFVVTDVNDNGQLDTNETLIMLNTPKTRYIVERDGAAIPSIEVWERGVNLTASTHEDADGHGTAVSGILLGGQLGFNRKWVGVAPDAELMMVKVIGQLNTYLTVEEGLTWAFNKGADVILIEIGSWTYHYLDGSSTTESLIDTIVGNGIPVIAPSGNLGGKEKHSLFHTSADTAYYVDFSIPTPDGEWQFYDIEHVYITVLSVNNTDFSACNFSMVFDMTSYAMPPLTQYLHPGVGKFTWFPEPPIPGPAEPNFIVESFISTSSRGTSMLGIHIYSGPLPTTGAVAPWHQLNITAPQNTTFHGYISDDQTSWTGGCLWKSDISDNYEITWPSTADDALSVASYRTRNLVQSGWGPPDLVDDIAGFSSRGPRIDEILKQGVAAPGGFDVISDYANASSWSGWFNAFGALPFGEQFGGYRLFSGTSASGPHVAGCAALVLQVNSSTGSDMNEIIKSTATTGNFTGALPNPTWGYGRLDVLAAIMRLSPVIGTPTRNPISPTHLENVTVTVTVTDESGVDAVILSYYNGSSWMNITMNYNGTHYKATIPEHPNDTEIIYRIYANDTLGNWAVSDDYTYTVQSSTSTTTPTTTTETTTTSPPPPDEPDYLLIAMMLTATLAFIVIAMLLSRRRSRGS